MTNRLKSKATLFQSKSKSMKNLIRPEAFNKIKNSLTFLVSIVWLSATVIIVAAQKTPLVTTQIKLTSARFISQDGLTVDKLVETAFSRRADLLAARQRLAIAEGKLLQAGVRPNPILEGEYGTPRVLGGDAESDFSVGISQVFELGGKRTKRVKIVELEIAQIRAEVAALERQVAAEIRTAYASAIAAARQLDVLERLMAADEDVVRITEARMNQGDAAPIDSNLVKLESVRLRVQSIEFTDNLETALLTLQSLTGSDVAKSLTIAPQTERPSRITLSLADLTEMALRERNDLQAAKIAEQIGTARIDLAKSLTTPNIAGSVKYSRNKSSIELPTTAGGGTAFDRDNTLTVGVAIELPFFNRNQGEIASATSEQIQATQKREFLESTIKRDVAVAYRKYWVSAQKMALYSTQILPRAEENLKTVRAAYSLGEFSVFEVVNEQRRLNESLAGYNESLRDYYKALAEIETALGIQLPASAFDKDDMSVLPNKKPVEKEKENTLNSPFDQEKIQTVKLTVESKPEEEDKK